LLVLVSSTGIAKVKTECPCTDEVFFLVILWCSYYFFSDCCCV